MPVTKTAKRALRSSKRKSLVNKKIISDLEIAIRLAKRSPSTETIKRVYSLADRASKKHVIHKNKSARIKSSLAKISPKHKVKKIAPKKKSKTAKTSKKR